MASNKILVIINISLALLAFLLILQLLEIKLPVLGKSYENKTGAQCIINVGDEYILWKDLDHCCLEARQQLNCRNSNLLFQKNQFDWVCQTGSSKLKYWLNDQAYDYCTSQVIW